MKVSEIRPKGFEWMDDVPSDEIRDILCEKCNEVTEQEINPYTTDGCGNIVFGWICVACGSCSEIYEKK